MVRTSFQSCLVFSLVAGPFGAAPLRAQTVLWSYGSRVTDLDRLGDFDGDGVPDVVVVDAVSGLEVPTILSGVDGSVIGTLNDSSLRGGSHVASGGDKNGDGVPDVLFGDPGYQDAQGNSVGRVALLSGSGGTLLSVYGKTPDWYGVGCCVRGMGDMDGNGRFDFTYGIGQHSSGGGWPGPSNVALIGVGGVDLPWHFDSPSSNVITPLDDVDGDAVLDFAASYVDQSSGIGAVQILSSAKLSLLSTITGASKDEHFGIALGTCGDADGDGLRDLVVGAPNRKVNGTETGAIVVYSSATSSALYELDGDLSGQHFGIDMDELDDVDGDGVRDFVVASNGSRWRLQVFSAVSGRELFRYDGSKAYRIRDVGDLDGDGYDDLAACDDKSATALACRPFVGLKKVSPNRVRWDRVGTLALKGAGFTADPNLVVQIDGVPATNVVVTDYENLTCTPPPLLPGPHDVTVSDQFGSATLAGGLLLTPATFVDGDAAIGSTITLRYEFEALDSTFAIAGLPPLQSIPTPPFGNALAISPFQGLFVVNGWPTDEYTMPATIPNDPALVGVTMLLQALIGPKIYGPGRDGAWTNVVEITFH